MEIAEKLSKQADNLRNNGLGDEAAKIYGQAAGEFEKVGELQKVASCWHMKGVSLKHRPAEAMPAFEKAIKLYEQAGDEVGPGRVYRDMGIPYLYRHQYKQANEWLLKSRQALEKTDNRAELGITVAKIGLIQIATGEFEAADATLYEALALIRSQTNWFYEMTTLLHLAALRLKQGRFNDCLNSVWAGIATISQEQPNLSLAELTERYGRRFAQLYGIAAGGYLGLGLAEIAADYMQRSLKLITPMADDAASIVLEDINMTKWLDKLLDVAPETHHAFVGKAKNRRLIELAKQS